MTDVLAPVSATASSMPLKIGTVAPSGPSKRLAALARA